MDAKRRPGGVFRGPGASPLGSSNTQTSHPQPLFQADVGSASLGATAPLLVGVPEAAPPETASDQAAVYQPAASPSPPPDTTPPLPVTVEPPAVSSDGIGATIANPRHASDPAITVPALGTLPLEGMPVARLSEAGFAIGSITFLETGSTAAAAVADPAGSAAGSSGTGTQNPPAPTPMMASSGHLVINLIPDSSVRSAPAGFTAAVTAAATLLEQAFTDNVTLNIRYGWGSYNNQISSSLIGANDALGGPLNGNDQMFATIKNWLQTDASSSDDFTAVAHLPASNGAFLGGWNSFYVTSAEAKALGHYTGLASTIDGAIGFGTGWLDPTDWVGAAVHELAHAIGRTTYYYEPAPTILDMFRYSSPGAYQWVGGDPAYFSIDGGATPLANFDTTTDYADWSVDGLTPTDPFDNIVNSNDLTQKDITVLDVLGFSVIPPSNPPDTTPPVFVNDLALIVPIGASGTFTPALLSVSDPDNSAVDLTYSVTRSPTHGTLEKNGLPTSQFTQADINNGSISYLENGGTATADSFSISVADPANNTLTGLVPITIQPAIPTMQFFQFAHQSITARTTTQVTSGGVTTTLQSVGGYAFVDVSLPGSFISGSASYQNITGNGRTDLIMQTPDHTFYFASGSGTGGTGGLGIPTVGLTQGGITGFIPHQTQFVDINGDGRTDSIFQGLDNRFWVNYGTATGFTGAQLVAQEGGPFNPLQTQYGDVNGDGKADLIFQGLDNRFWIDYGTANGFSGAQFAAQEGGPFNPAQVQYADVNGDGKADLIYQGIDNRFWISDGTGSGFGPAVLGLTQGGPFIGGQMKYADVNGDGKADAVFQGADNRVWLSLSNGTTFNSAVLAATLPQDVFDTGKVQLLDMNGDGKADLMYQTATNQIWEFLSTGTGFAAGKLVANFGGTYAPDSVGYGDLNGDHLGDIVYQDASNNFRVSLQNFDWFK